MKRAFGYLFLQFFVYGFLFGEEFKVNENNPSCEIFYQSDLDNIYLEFDIVNDTELSEWVLSSGDWKHVIVEKSASDSGPKVIHGGWYSKVLINRFFHGFGENRNPVIPIKLIVGQTTNLKITLQEPFIRLFPSKSKIVIQSLESFEQINATNNRKLWTFVTILLVFASLHLFIFFILKKPIFLTFFFLQIIQSMIWINGFGFLFPQLINCDCTYMLMLDVPLAFLFMGVYLNFSRQYLKVQYRFKGIDKWIRNSSYALYFLAFLALISGLISFDSLHFYVFSWLSLYLFPLVSFVIVSFLIVRSVLNRYFSAYFFLITMLFFHFGILLTFFSSIGIINSNMLTQNAMILGAIIYSFSFTIDLAQRVLVLSIEKQKSEKRMFDKEKELMSNTISSIQKDKIIDQIKVKVNDLSAKNKYELLSLLKNTQSIDKDWRLFHDSLDQVGNRFVTNLIEKHPNLTANDIRLCSLQRLSLSSKEISKILNINPRSVDQNKYRLKQKIGLAKHDDLNVYLRHF